VNILSAELTLEINPLSTWNNRKNQKRFASVLFLFELQNILPDLRGMEFM